MHINPKSLRKFLRITGVLKLGSKVRARARVA